jgi:serine protease Do
MNLLRKLIVIVFSLIACGAGAQVRELPDFTELVEQQGAAVVNISTTQIVRNRGALPHMPNLDEDDPMFEFFRRFIPRQPGGPREFESKSLGSGFIVSGDGYILTNAHVVEGADEIVVKLNDKREFKAKVIGADKRTDVALLKVEAAGLPTVRMGDPSRLKVGEWVVAIGSPFGFENSVTAGIVSAKGRSLPQENYVPFIQTDVAVNPGNSGGPLFNLKGEVVGVNSQIYSRTGGFMGLSFAIPIDIAMEVQSQLRTSGRVSRGRIGVVIQEVTRELADSFGMQKATGALVASVEKGGPADKAGVEAGDVILKFNGKPVGSSSELPRLVGNTRPGSKAEIQVWRKGATRELGVTVAEMPEEKVAAQGAKKPKAELAANRLGLIVSDLSAEQRQELNVSGGVLVEDVREGARTAEIRGGDVILSVIVKGTSNEVKSAEQFNRLVAQIEKGSNVTLLVRRGGNQTFVTLRNVG